MFCSKCGTQLTEEVKFCPSCGASTGESSKASSGISNATYGSLDNLSGSKTYFYASLVSSIVLIILILQKWVKFSIPLYDEHAYVRYSLLDLLGIYKEYKQVANGEPLLIANLFIFVMFGLFAVSVIAMVIFCVQMFRDKSKCISWGKISMSLTIVLSIYVIVLMFFVSKTLDHETYGFVKISTTVIPYITGVIAVVGRVYILGKLKQELNIY